MPIFGVSTEKVDERLDPWVNTYYLNNAALAGALADAAVLGAAEATIHSTLVTVVRAHVWQVGSSPPVFTDVPIDLPGEIDATNALPAWFTAECNLTAVNSYPGWKRYRTRVGRSQYSGPNWLDAYVLVLEAFCDVIDELDSQMVTRAGAVFSGFDPNPIPQPLQLGKKWYNRTGS